MRKRTIFKYELRRLLLSKEYLILLFTTLTYGISLLRGMILYGTNYTAPYSHLTFLTYCSALDPFLFALLLLLISKQSKASEIGAEAVVCATPMPVPVFRLMRYCAALCAFLLAAALPLIACFSYYRLVFDYTAVGELLFPGLMLLLPSAVFLMGAGVLIANRKPAAIYILLAAVLIIGAFHIRLPESLDFTGISVLTSMSSESDAFLIPSVYITGRLAFFGIGIVFVIASLLWTQKNP